MARYGQKEPTKAFPSSQTQPIWTGVHRACRRISTMYYEQFTCSELLELFIEPGDRAAVRRAYELNGGNSAHTQNLFVTSPWARQRGGEARIRFQWDFRDVMDGFFVPLKQGGRIETAAMMRDDAPQDLKDRFTNMADNLVRTSYEWGMVMYVFNSLNRNGYCNTPQQMRYVWPAISTLLSYGGNKDLAKQLSQPSARAGDKARVPYEVRDLIKPSADVVTRSLLCDMDSLPDGCSLKPSISVQAANYEVSPGNVFVGL